MIRKVVMKKFLLLFFLVCSISANSQEYLVAGCGYDRVSVINKQGDVIWSKPVPGSDCNDAEITSDGCILLAYKYGAMLVNRDKKIMWNIEVDYPNEEMYTATQLENGNYLLACCGLPSRIMEVNHDGKIIKELKYDTGIKNVHSQFRQIVRTAKNTYIIPVMGKGVIREISAEGKLLREVKVGGTPFQVNVLKNGNWLIAGGDGGMVIEIVPETAQVVRRIDNSNFKLCKLKFVAECRVLENGNILVANWAGHDRSNQEAPIVLEIDTDNNMVWSLYANSDIYRISTLSLIDKSFTE